MRIGKLRTNLIIDLALELHLLANGRYLVPSVRKGMAISQLRVLLTINDDDEDKALSLFDSLLKRAYNLSINETIELLDELF